MSNLYTVTLYHRDTFRYATELDVNADCLEHALEVAQDWIDIKDKSAHTMAVNDGFDNEVIVLAATLYPGSAHIA